MWLGSTWGEPRFDYTKCYSIDNEAAGEGGSAGGSNNPPGGSGPQPGDGGGGSNNNPNPCVIIRQGNALITTNAVKTNSYDDDGTDDGGYPNPNGGGNNNNNDPCNPVTFINNEIALEQELENNESLLIDCATVKKFKPLASFLPSSQVLARLTSLNTNSTDFTLFSNPFFVQKIQNAVGYEINLDRFEINVSALPTVGSTQLTASQFLDLIRTNINSFIDQNIAHFQPYYDPNDQINDNAKWQSSNPLGSILHIDMADNGSVLVSDVSSDHWTVSTLRTPIDGAHPVSGNRSWRYTSNPNGTYTFYVTGVDRLTTGRQELAQYIFGIPFNKADNLWESFQAKVSQFVNDHNGAAQIGAITTERPNYQSIADYLNNKITLEQLKAIHGCQ